MKKLFLYTVSLILSGDIQSQSVGIGTSAPSPSAQLDVRSTSKGFLPPRMTYAQRDAILNPVAGLIIWCSDCDEIQVYNGTIWKNLSGNAASGPGFPNVTICNGIWMIKNLDVRNYRNGDPIPEVTDQKIWDNITIGAWCWYNNDSSTYSSYGKLYNWYAATDSRGLAPQGWHVPDNTEWASLTDCLGGGGFAGGKMKTPGIAESGTGLWLSPNYHATNSSGFSGLPGGTRGLAFGAIGVQGYWLSTTEGTPGRSYYRALIKDNESLINGTNLKNSGMSVRCVKD